MEYCLTYFKYAGVIVSASVIADGVQANVVLFSVIFWQKFV